MSAPLSRITRRTVLARVALIATVGLCVLAAVTALTIRTTVLQPRFYSSVTDRTNTFERIYDEVLVDPKVVAVAADLSARQPPELADAIGVNIRLVLPPGTLRELVHDQIAAFLRWLRGDTDTLRLDVPLRPVIANLQGAASAYVSELLAATPALKTVGTSAFRQRIQAVLADLRAGRRPAAVPTIPIDQEDRDAVAGILLAQLPADARAAAEPQLRAALLTDNLSDALAVVGIDTAAVVAGVARSDLLARAGGGRWPLTPHLEQAVSGRELDAVRTARWWLGWPLSVLLYGSIVLGLLALVALSITTGRTRRQRAVDIVIALGSGALLAGGIGLLLWLWLGALTRSPGVPATWPDSIRNLVTDNIATARTTLMRRWFALCGAAAAATLGVAVAALVPAARRSLRAASASRRISRRRLAKLTAITVLPLCFLAVAGILLTAVPSDRAQCNGQADLCQRRYDQVAELATHNAMASTQAGFLFPLQDVDITTQLNAGARALQLDSWTWEQPDQVTGRLDDAGFPPSVVAAATTILATVNPPRPGAWLCHGVCRLGAVPMVATLEKLRRWLDRNPASVVTIVLQDETPAAVTKRAFVQAGLVPYLAVPPADPASPWPTLGDMIASGHRLVAFTENAHDAAPWLQNFYTYGEETPFAFRSASALAGDASCVPNRGGSGRTLFLLNHFVTAASGSRSASAQVNSAPFLNDRIDDCAATRHRLPTIVAVDFATLGDAQRVVDDLNRRRQ